MSWVTLVVGALALAVLGRGATAIARGRSVLHAPDAGAEERMLASLRVAGGIRLLNAGLLLVVLTAVAAVVVR